MIADHDERLRQLVEAITEGPGALDPAIRRGASRLAALPAPLGAFVEKLAGAPARVTGDDIRDLRAAGLTQDQVFELTMCAALGAAEARLKAGLQALEEAEPW